MAGGDVPWTPGPWTVEGGGITGPDWQLVAMPRDGHVYSEYTSDPATLEINNPANARLIAAAPEMAEALRLVIGMADGDDAELDESGEEICPFELCRDILTRIRGEQ